MKRKVQVVLPPGTWERLEKRRVVQGCTYTSFVRIAVEDLLDRLDRVSRTEPGAHASMLP